MAVQFNHTIVSSRDQRASAAFLAEMLGLPEPTRWGPFHVVMTANDANIDFMNSDKEITPQHYAFLVDEGVRRDFGADSRAGFAVLGGSRADEGGRDQSPR